MLYVSSPFSSFSIPSLSLCTASIIDTFSMTCRTSSSSFFFKANLGPESFPRATSRIALPKIPHINGLNLNSNMQRWSCATPSTDDHEELTYTIFSGKQYVPFEKKVKYQSEQTVGKNFGPGSYLPNSAIFQQKYSIRAYEIGATGKISFETLMNLLQETSINSVKSMGLEIDMKGSTPEMRKRNLVWVPTKAHIIIDRYPSCEDIVQVENWIARAGKNTMRRDSVIRDCQSGRTLVTASSILMMMDTKTRRMGKIPEEVWAEVKSYLVDAPPVIEDENKKLQELDEANAGYICSDLKPRRSDLDLHQHVNNEKYIEWIFESIPRLLLEDHELSRITMEYKKECHKDNVLKSLTTVSGSKGGGNFIDPLDIECSHLLQLDNGLEIMRARSEWRPKRSINLVMSVI